MNRFAEAIAKAGVEVVPQVVVGGRNEKGSNGQNLMEGLLAMLLSERMGVQLIGNGNGSGSRPGAAALREQILRRLMNEQAKGTTASATTTTQVLAPSTSD